MPTRYFALIAGILYGLIGIAGFVPGFVQPPPEGSPSLAVGAGYGYLFGLFPINVLHNLVHLGLGVWGLAAYGSFSAARIYARALAIIFGVLTVMGLLPVLSTIFGLVPLFGHDIWLHALTALVAAYFGWRAAPVQVRYAGQERRA